MAASQLRDEIKQARPFDIPETEVYLNVIRTEEALRSRVGELLKDYGLSQSSYNVLRILRGAGATGLPSQEIGNRLVTRVPDVTRLVDRLERSGLVRRSRTAEDRRVVIVAVTTDGLELLKVIDQPILDLQRSLLGHLDPQEMQTLSTLLAKARRGSVEPAK